MILPALRSLLPAAALLLCASIAQATDLVIIQNGETVGHVRADEQGSRITVDYLVDSNGRGPRHREEIVLGPNGIPISYSVEGRSLMGAPVSESFSWENGRATWRSQADEGSVAAASAPLYIVNPLSAQAKAHAHGSGFARLFSTHPPMEERIERLRRMAGQPSLRLGTF